MTQLDPTETFIAGHEGNRSRVYDDKTGKDIVPGSVVRGHPTIGVGIRLDGAGLEPEEIEWLLKRRVARARAAAEAYPWFAGLTPARQAVVVSMAFQMGAKGLQEFKRTRTHIAAGCFDWAADEMLKSDWALHDSPERARNHAAIMRSGEWPA